ncbi:hypothetical protein NBO_914g0004 [Nosema bombycis CQ1]|uniref:Sm domain-containing protein n=1 Tax=Nosema bombycis (strain CQ1 / CVCC 102059) TaxID=578461 RepID=R0KM73_NOSB1|nr:hypothetical protein NBO_914g0004 [Nosema bombycis CQ1]|eukprot:EOB11751.1 hypothetical protein NBO_914g0004 [Nosema bombycis CQ1]
MDSTLKYLTVFLNSPISIKLKTGEILSGKLEAVDEHTNVILSECDFEDPSQVVFIRGENIHFISK